MPKLNCPSKTCRSFRLVFLCDCENGDMKPNIERQKHRLRSRGAVGKGEDAGEGDAAAGG